MKKTKKEYKGRPWLEFYDEEGIPSNIEYPDFKLVHTGNKTEVL